MISAFDSIAQGLQ